MLGNLVRPYLNNNKKTEIQISLFGGQTKAKKIQHQPTCIARYVTNTTDRRNVTTDKELNLQKEMKHTRNSIKMNTKLILKDLNAAKQLIYYL